MEDLIKRLAEREEENSNAIGVLRVQGEQTRKDLDRALSQLDEVQRCVHRIEVMQAERKSIPMCSAPNLCLELKTHLEKLTSQVESLVENRAEQRGGVKAVMLIAALLGGTAGFGGAYGAGKLGIVHQQPAPYQHYLPAPNNNKTYTTP